MLTTRLECPLVDRVWVPAVACPACFKPNDEDFIFCSRCGFHRELRPAGLAVVEVDWDFIDERKRQLNEVALGFTHEKARDAEFLMFERFLFSGRVAKQATEATPVDVVEYLIWKESKGRTQYHVMDCPEKGGKGISQVCNCRVGAAKGSVQVTLSKIRMELRERGMTERWNSWNNKGNPVDSEMVVRHERLIRKESADAQVIPNRASPVWSYKIKRVVTMLFGYLYAPMLGRESPLQRLIYSHDAFYFVLQMKAGRRCSDFSNIHVDSCLFLPEGKGMLFNVFWEKAVRSGDESTFCVLKDEDSMMDVVTWFERYKRFAALAALPLGSSYLFRHLTPWGTYDASVRMQSGTLNTRFVRYLQLAEVYEGESLHGIRAGAGLEFLFAGHELAVIMAHQSWKSKRMGELYTECSLLFEERNLTAPGMKLSEVQTREMADRYDELNRLARAYRVVGMPSG